MIKLKLLLNHKTKGFQRQKSCLIKFKVTGVNKFLTEIDGHLSETLMETKTTFRLAGHHNMGIFLEDLTQTQLDGQLGQIQQVWKLFAPYLITHQLIKACSMEEIMVVRHKFCLYTMELMFSSPINMYWSL